MESHDSIQLRVPLSNRRLLKRKFLDVENDLRGTLKAFGIKIGKVIRGRFEARITELLDGVDPTLRGMVISMLRVRRMLWDECLKLASDAIALVEPHWRTMEGPLTRLA